MNLKHCIMHKADNSDNFSNITVLSKTEYIFNIGPHMQVLGKECYIQNFNIFSAKLLLSLERRIAQTGIIITFMQLLLRLGAK